MHIKTISFIEVKPPGVHVFSKFPIPRIGSVLLSTMLRNEGYTVRAFVEDIAEIDWPFVERSDVVCLSTITSTAPRAYEVADRLKRLGIVVIMGGAHPSFMPEEALDHCDYVVRGEGDITLPELLRSLRKGTPFPAAVQGISYRDKEGVIVHTPARPLLADMDILPEPDFSLVQGWKPSHTYPVSTSRGCPHTCTFCSVIQLFGRKYRFRSVEKTVREIAHAASRYDATIFFVDDNFAAHKERTKAILKEVVAAGIAPRWSAQVRTDIAKDAELLRLMADSGCNTLYIGFESINPRTLELYEKRQSLDDILHCIRAVKDHGISIHGMFVLGADTDTLDTVKRTADFAVDLGIDTVQFMLLTPLPGTPVFAEMELAGRLLHKDWSTYDMHHVVFRPALMEPATFQIETLKAMGKFYSWKYILKHLLAFDFHYAALGYFGHRAVKQSLERAMAYLERLEPSGSLLPA